MRPVRVVAAAALCLVAALSACAGSTNGSPPYKICGTTVWNGAAGAAGTQAYRQSAVAAVDTAGKQRNNYYILASSSCKTGSQVNLDQVMSSVVRVIRASDGGTHAVVLGTVPAGKTLTIVTADHRTHVVTFDGGH